MEIGRIIRLVHEEYRLIIKNRRLTNLSVTGDLFSFLTQSVVKFLTVPVQDPWPMRILGDSIMAAADSANSMHNGQNIVVGGLLLQIVFFGFYISVTTIFDCKIRRPPTQQSCNPAIPWRKHLMVLYTASVMIMVRNVFRVVEYVQSDDRYLLRHEYYLYLFDALLMVYITVVFNIVHPSEVNALLKGGIVCKGLKMVALKKNDSFEPGFV